jgi:hypothetical protein
MSARPSARSASCSPSNSGLAAACAGNGGAAPGSRVAAGVGRARQELSRVARGGPGRHSSPRTVDDRGPAARCVSGAGFARRRRHGRGASARRVESSEHRRDLRLRGSSGLRFLVLELVDGPTLADKLLDVSRLNALCERPLSSRHHHEHARRHRGVGPRPGARRRGRRVAAADRALSLAPARRIARRHRCRDGGRRLAASTLVGSRVALLGDPHGEERRAMDAWRATA